MIKVAVVVNNLKAGMGITEWVAHYYNELCRLQDVKITIIVESGKIEIAPDYLDKRINIIRIPHITRHPFGYILSWMKLMPILKHYNYIHFQVDNLTKFFPLLLLMNNDNVIVHSHNSTNDKVLRSRGKRVLNDIGKLIVKKRSFIKFACSNLAARWLFGNSRYIQINNGIDLKMFRYNSKQRQKYKKNFNLESSIVYGHIGRFSEQKNHKKLIRVFYKIHALDPSSVLLLVGDGPLRKSIEHLVKHLGLEDAVRFLGYREDVSELLSLFDVIVFPSLYEGMPISLIEAQAAGVTVFYSNKITSDVKLLPQTTAFDIEMRDDYLAREIVSKSKSSLKMDREKAIDLVRTAGFSDEDVLKKIYDFYASTQHE